MSLPRCVWYDPKRRRYRVRVYRKNRVVHLSYHRSREEALKAYRTALATRQHIRRHERPICTTAQQIAALKDNLV